MVGRKDYPELTEAVLEQWRTSALEDLEAGRPWQCHPLAVLAVVEALDQGCEMCDHMVTDRMDLPDDPEYHKAHAHFWVCGGCWNAEAERRASTGHVASGTRKRNPGGLPVRAGTVPGSSVRIVARPLQGGGR